MRLGEKNRCPCDMKLGEPQIQPGCVNILFLETSGPDMEFVTLLSLCRGSFLQEIC
jgi:hypothetical protein